MDDSIEYVQISVMNHQNFQPETLLSLPSMLSVLGYTLTSVDEFTWTFDFLFDYHDPRAEPNDKELENWLKLRYFEVDIERYKV